MEPFRFVHASRLLLDHQLRDTGPLPDSIRPIVEDATLLAWDRVVETCLSERVDLLLLAGDSFDQADRSLRGPAALVRGFERLAEGGVTVAVAPGRCDPWDAWPASLRLPSNVVRLDGSGEAPIVRDDSLLATIRSEPADVPATAQGPRLLRLPTEADRPFEIRVIGTDGTSGTPGSAGPAADASDSSVEYLAAGGAFERRTILIGSRMIHDPGPAQAIHPRECGPRGCTLVAVDASGRCRRRFIPTAPVRFEQLGLSVEPGQTRDDLLLEMIAALEHVPRHDSDRVWLIAWNVFGAEHGRNPLADEAERRQILEILHADHGIEGVHVQTHDLRMRDATSDFGAAETGDELTREFARRLDERTAHPQRLLERCLAESRLREGPWAEQLGSLLADLDAGEIVAAARRQGMTWFAEGD